jgi:hypothetical protein
VINKGVCSRDSVDIGLMSREYLSGLATPNVPQFGSRIASTRYEDVLVGAEGQVRREDTPDQYRTSLRPQCGR